MTAPTRILSWNIENFGENSPGTSTPKHMRNEYQAYVLGVIKAVQPHIIVLVEIAGTKNGQLIDNHAACLDLQAKLAKEDSNWRLIPPFNCGGNGGVAMLYLALDPSGRKRFFTGPKFSQGNKPGDSPPPGRPQKDVSFGKNYARKVVGERKLDPCVTTYLQQVRGIANPPEYENSAAPQTSLGLRASYQKNKIKPSDAVRDPYRARFVEVENDQVTRELNIIGVHGPASGDQQDYLRRLAGLKDVATPVVASEARVLIGDFNLDSIDDLPDKQGGYHALITPSSPGSQKYELALDPSSHLGQLNQKDGSRDYFVTIIRGKDKATWGPGNQEESPYPGFRYIDRKPMQKTNKMVTALDNAFTAHGANAKPNPGANGPSIVNAVAGSPYRPFKNNGQLPTGHFTMGRLVELPPPSGDQAPEDPKPPVGTEEDVFRKSYEARVRSISDHLPIVIEV
ncbi:hypothetical protein [Streptomyces chattanoogensis]|uniref:Endonuclease/exonuclease/phosphatase domain-containing protein n=1 Tax=Streptomyces chattanoogensis TaxID=66876 RepID=A0A0N0XTP9_9ACTN|nr:hypothetical protein [Streptomyces chattanoogensis]KPC60173.1 hypothetical protein ADL29_30965 [Streptomyces chattanoogensis]